MRYPIVAFTYWILATACSDDRRGGAEPTPAVAFDARIAPSHLGLLESVAEHAQRDCLPSHLLNKLEDGWHCSVGDGKLTNSRKQSIALRASDRGPAVIAVTRRYERNSFGD